MVESTVLDSIGQIESSSNISLAALHGFSHGELKGVRLDGAESTNQGCVLLTDMEYVVVRDSDFHNAR